MAPKRPSPLEEPHVASSSSESEEGNEEEEEEEEEVEEGNGEDDEFDEEKASSPSPPLADKKPSLKNPPTKPEPTPNLATEPHPQSTSDNEDDDDGSESDSDSDHPPTKPRESSSGANPNSIKPINSKPMDDLSKPKKPSVKADAPASSTPRKSAAAKRAIEYDEDGKDSKKKKKKGNEDEKIGEEDAGKNARDDSKKQLFQRLWSDDDEIVILKGMIDFHSEKGIDPYEEMDAFHEFIKKSLHVDVSKNQLKDKVRRLKKKFLNNAGKGKKKFLNNAGQGKNGEDPIFSKPHEHKSFELSKKIWSSLANNSAGADQVKANGKAGKRRKVSNFMVGLKDHEMKEEEEQSLSQYPYLNESLQSGNGLNESLSGLGENMVKEGLGLVGSSKTKEMEKKWKKLQIAEAEVYLQRVELIQGKMILIVDAIKSSLS